jgi:hypothetical protein
MDTTNSRKTRKPTRRGFVQQAAFIPTGLMAASVNSLTPQGEHVPASSPLVRDFQNPPRASQPWAYWWWLDGAASKAGITADLEQMRRQGISGVLLFDAGEGGPDAPKGPLFMSDAWRENFRHAVREAGRLGIEMGVNLCSGWDAGGPWVTPDHAMKQLVFSEITVHGPGEVDESLPQPAQKHGWYRDIAVLACRAGQGAAWDSRHTVDLTPDTRDGRLSWKAPEGIWTVLRLGYTLGGQRTKNASSRAAEGWELDPLSREAFDQHFAETAAKLIQDAGEWAGRTLKYTHIDSWEIGQPGWTVKFLDEFRRRRGYDPLPYLPALAKKKVDSPEVTERFLWDYRRTLADLVAENYYGRLSDLSHQRGLGSHAESGGPFYTQYVDLLECEGAIDIPMAEFWLARWDRGKLLLDWEVRSVRQAASAAHVYGKPLCQAEAFTDIVDDWIEDPYALKRIGDRAFCLGLTRNVLCFYVHQPRLDIKPGYQWAHVGAHFDRNITWWDQGHAWLKYLARCQHMLRQGAFVADWLYFSGEDIPTSALMDQKPVDGHDYDVINAQALLSRTRAEGGRVVLPDGMSYRYLVLQEDRTAKMTPAVLEKLRELVEGGVTLVGSRPRQAPGLTDYPRCDEKLKAMTDELWGPRSGPSGKRRFGRGRVIWGKNLEAVAKADGLTPDLEFRQLPEGGKFDWIHRRNGDTDIYFLSNQTERAAHLEAVFRVAGRAPELWDAVTGAIRPLPEFRVENGRTAVPMRFEPKQSFFVVFRPQADRAKPVVNGRNFPEVKTIAEIAGPWEVRFAPKWGGPPKTTFAQLEDWTRRPEEGIRYYSGTATYRRTFDLSVRPGNKVHLDLGTVKNLAQVRLNGKDLGVIWTAPWRVEITDCVKAKGNELEIEIVNLWPNRLIGDGKLPKEQRRTVTNVKTYDAALPPGYRTESCPNCEGRRKAGKELELLPSGLLGPVTVKIE